MLWMSRTWIIGLFVLAAGCVRDVHLSPPATGSATSTTTDVPCEGEGCSKPCRRHREPCIQPEDCCSGLCELKGEGEGTCKSSGCRVAHDACGRAKDCCSGVCLLSELGGGHCQPASGCSPAGERCTSGLSCCSGLCRPGPEAVRRCAVAGCRRLGEVCERSNDCCDKDPQSCRTGDSAASRCLGAPGAFDVCQPGGAMCAVPEQCCSKLCTIDRESVLVCAPVATSISAAADAASSL
jgi:hypothetical protein